MAPPFSHSSAFPSAAVRRGWPLLLAGGLHLAIAVLFIRHGALNPDEGFYAAASRAVFAGEVPYRDFGYTQTPLLPYINGALLQFTGSGLFAQRAVNALWGALALGLAGWWLTRRVNAAAALLMVAAFTLSAPWMYFIHLGKTYALTGFLAVAAAWIWLEGPAGAKKSAVLGLLGVIGVGCRLPAAPFFGGLWLASLWDGRRPTRAHAAVAGVALLAALAALILPFYLAAPKNAVFWVLEFHRISVPLKFWRLAWQEIATLAPALWMATLGAAALLLGRHARCARREAVLAAVALGALAANLLPAGVYEEYGVPFLLPLAMSVAAVLGRMAGGRAIMASLLLGVHVFATPLVLWRDFPERRLSPSQWLTPNAPRLNPALPAQLVRARQIVQALTPPNAPLVGPNLILALEADRPVPPNLRMGPFSVTSTLPPEFAARRHLATPAEIESYLRDPSVSLLALFPQAQLNYEWTMPTFERVPAEISTRWQEIQRRDFPLVQQEGNFLLRARSGAPAAPLR